MPLTFSINQKKTHKLKYYEVSYFYQTVIIIVNYARDIIKYKYYINKKNRSD